MNPYKEDGPCARLSFDRAYCKRCTGPPSVNDGYITRTGAEAAPPTAAGRPDGRPCGDAPPPGALPPARRAVRTARRETLSRRLKLSFGSAATGPL